MVADNLGGERENAIDPTATPGARGTGRLVGDSRVMGALATHLGNIARYVKQIATDGPRAVSALSGLFSAAGRGGGAMGGGASRINVPDASAVNASMRASGSPRVGSTLRGGGGGGGGSGLGSSLRGFVEGGLQPAFDLMNATSRRIERGAEYSLQADRMSAQLQQMYGMSNATVRNQLRMPLTSHYMLGGGAAVNELLGMQANTGLTAAKQASTVEAFRGMTGYSLSSTDAVRMLTTMASPDVANRMFMMGGTGMYGIGGKERTGMQSIQDIVRRTGLTNPEALKGALQQGSNTRQRLSSMGVPQDMQDMVIQYAMQNTQYQRKTGDKTVMYDPSLESNRETMGIEGNYITQHEKTTGERLKREERFYGKQTDNFARFEKNLRLTTQALAAFEDALGGIIGLGISVKGHPVTQMAQYGIKQAYSQAMNTVQLAGDVVETGAGAMIPGGDAGDGRRSGDAGDGISTANEKKLATLDPRLSVPLRNMLLANPKLHIGDARRSSQQQEISFKERYRPTNRPLSSKGENDRIWNGVLWEMKPGNSYPMAAPGNSYHETGLAADVAGDDEWVRANAAKYGLAHGGTRKGARSDEPFHVQPAGTLDMPKTSTPGVSSASVKRKTQATPKNVFSASYTPSSSQATFTNAGQMAAEVSKAGLKAQFAPTISGIDQPRGDAGDGRGTGLIPQSNAPSITIAPNIYLNGGGDLTADMRRLAREVGKILEQEVSMVMARSR